jgi:hypothetical protein
MSIFSDSIETTKNRAKGAVGVVATTAARGMRIRHLLQISFTLPLLSLATGCEHRAPIIPGDVAVSAWDDGVSIGTQLRLKNVGKSMARDLRITRVKVTGGNYNGLVALPASLGDLAAGKDVPFDALLKVAAANGSQRVLTLKGTYLHGYERRKFHARWDIRPDAAPPGPFSSVAGQTTKQNPSTVVYPPAPPPTPFRPNAESPVFVPIGPARQLFPPTPTGTALGTSAGAASVQIPRNTTMRSAGTPPDPNSAAATADGVVLATYNTGISLSTDGGQTFTDIPLLSPQPGNPSRTSFFPESDGGLCCDQSVVYTPNQDLFVWLLLYLPVTACATNCPPASPPAPPATFSITQPNRLRVAWATPAAVAADFWNAWTFVDLTGINVAGVSSGLGINNNEWLDYPDLAFSNTFLYVGLDHGSTTPGAVYNGRRIVARLSLADIVNPAVSSVGYNVVELTGTTGLNKTHFVQGAPGQMVVGSLDNSSTMRVYTWPDNEASPSTTTVGISQIQAGAAYTSMAPDNTDWLAVSFPGNITGGVYRQVATGSGTPLRDEYLFAFDAGANTSGGRPRAYLRLETLTPSGNSYNAFSEYDIWNDDYAFAMGGLGTDGSEIGITLAVGGGTVGFPQSSVGYKDDFVVYQVTNSNATQVSRFGDYVCNRPIAGGLFATEVYDVILNPLPPGVTSGTCATVGCTANMRFVEYGRPPVSIK